MTEIERVLADFRRRIDASDRRARSECRAYHALGVRFATGSQGLNATIAKPKSVAKPSEARGTMKLDATATLNVLSPRNSGDWAQQRALSLIAK